MAKSIIAYDRDLPEIADRCPWLPPDSHLVKDAEAPNGWREESGRRRSNVVLVNKLRRAVARWRHDGYPGASEVTRRLFEYWFDEDHKVPEFDSAFHYHFGQREAIETLIYIVEIAANHDAVELLKAFAEIKRKDLFEDTLEFQTTVDGKRQVHRYLEELDREGVQDLPPENLRRYAFKMATGSGKTWVMAMAIVWCYFHRRMVSGSDLSTNFLIVAPNVIVYQRLERDFASNRIFHQLPLIPPEWKGQWSMKVILRGDSAEPDPSGNLFLVNIQQLYESRDKGWTPQNAIDALLGPKPQKDLAKHERSMLERIRGLKDLVVLNDEAHHVHREDLIWTQSLLSIHSALPKGLCLWLDFSATPKDQNGMYFPWIICDYPLAQSVEDRIVKAPLTVTLEDDPHYPGQDPDHVTGANAVEKYGFWIQAAVNRWKDHHTTYKKLGVRPVLFIMAEKNNQADAIGQHLVNDLGFRKSEVLVIHTDNTGEITKKDLELARKAAGEIDLARSRIKAIVSVMMLREGWDVRNVSVCLGLRPFTAKAEILPEQVIGRGLRIMQGVSPDRTQTLEVLGTKNLLDMLRERLEAEGVGVTTTKSDPPASVTIEPIQEKIDFDISLPITKPRLTHNIKKLADLDPDSLSAIYDEPDLDEPVSLKLRMEFAVTETEIHAVDLAIPAVPMAQELLSTVTNKVMTQARLSNVFSQLYPLVRQYVGNRCFGQPVDVDEEDIRNYLCNPYIQDGIAKYLARKISELTVEKRTLEFEQAAHKLSDTKPFMWRRNLTLGPLVCDRTIFNYVATYNDFERRFAQFLDQATDVLRFAALGTTQQGDSGTQFRVDYLKSSGAIGFYHPDWVAIQETDDGEVNWIIETKGRVWENTKAKDAAMHDWCARVSEQTGQSWRFSRVDQINFDSCRPKSLAQAVTETNQSPELFE